MKDIFIVLWEPNQQPNPSYLSEAKSRAVRKRHEARAAAKRDAAPRRNRAKSSLNNHQQTAKVSKASTVSRSQPGYSAKPRPNKTGSIPFPPSNTTSREKCMNFEPSRLEEQAASCLDPNIGSMGVPPMVQQVSMASGLPPDFPPMDVWQDLYPFTIDLNWLQPAADAPPLDGSMEPLPCHDWALANRFNCSQMYMDGM